MPIAPDAPQTRLGVQEDRHHDVLGERLAVEHHGHQVVGRERSRSWSSRSFAALAWATHGTRADPAPCGCGADSQVVPLQYVVSPYPGSSPSGRAQWTPVPVAGYNGWVAAAVEQCR